MESGIACVAGVDFDSGDFSFGPCDVVPQYGGLLTVNEPVEADYLQTQDLAQAMMAIVNSPYSAKNRTFLNAVITREWFQRKGISITRLDVCSSGTHTHRSRDLSQHAFGESVVIGIIAAEPLNFDSAHWWSANSTGKRVAVKFASWF